MNSKPVPCRLRRARSAAYRSGRSCTCSINCQAFRLELRREVEHVLRQESLPLDRRRPGGEGLRRRIPLARHRAFLDRPLFDRPHRLAGLAIEHEDEALLGRLRDRRDLPAVDGDVDEDRRARHVVIPDRMVHELVVPDALAGLQIDRDQAFGRTGYCRGDGRRNSRRWESRRAGRRCRAARPPSSASTRRCCRCTPTTFRATCRCRTRPGCGMVWKIHSRLPVRAS